MNTYMMTTYEQWLDQKPDIQHILDYPPGIIQPQPVTAQLVKVQNPYDIILELEKIYDVTELAQLTPPQTPPQELNVATKDVFDFAPIKQLQQHQQQPISEISNNGNFPTPPQTIIPQIYPTNELLDYSSDSTGSPMSPDIAREMQIVDEIIQDRAKDLPDWNDDDSMYSMSSSSASQNDDDWLPNSSSSSVSSESSPTSVKSGKMTNAGVTKKRVRPYGRGIEDKKSRKKEQNKNAATRYRQKKKQEMEEILEEERILVKRNDELLRNVSEIEREIKYLKQLMREFYKTKGLLK